MNAFVHEPRRRLTDQQRAALFLARGGKCECCGRRIRAGEIWHLDHRIALENGGDNSDGNLSVLCTWCHKDKTKEDHAKAAKSRHVATAHVVPTIHRQKKWKPLPGSRRSGWRKRMDGTVERRGDD